MVVGVAGGKSGSRLRLVVSPTSDGTSVDLDEAASNAKLDAWFDARGRHQIVVATGFIAKNKEWAPLGG